MTGTTTDRYALRGTELRYALTVHLFKHGPLRVPDLVDALDFDGFDIPGGAKAVFDALRWEIGHERGGGWNVASTDHVLCHAVPSTG
jgi:hypothetical protein